MSTNKPSQPSFKLTELAYSLRIIKKDYAEWCARPLPIVYQD